MSYQSKQEFITLEELESDLSISNTPPVVTETEEVKEVNDEGDKFQPPVEVNHFDSAEEFFAAIEKPVIENKEETIEEEVENVEEVQEEKVQKQTISDELSVADVLKATIALRVKKLGLEEQVDLDAEEWNEETYEKWNDELTEYQVGLTYDNVKNSDKNLKAVFDIIEKGGNFDALLDLRKEEITLNQIDTTTAEGKLQKIKKYYKEVMKKDDEWVEDQIEMLQTKNKVDKELTTISKDYDERFEARRNEIVQEQEKINQRKLQAKQVAVSKLSSILDANKFKDDVKNEYLDFVFNDEAYKITTTNEKLSAFDLAILKIKNKPEELVELVSFLKDKETYKKEIITKANSKKAESDFKSLLKKTPKRVEQSIEKPEKIENKFILPK